MEELRIGELILHPRVQLLRDGRPLAIGGRALDLLTVLASAKGEVVSKDRLIVDVWDGAIVEENAIQAQVSALRKALGDEARRLITIHRRGYRLDLDGTERDLGAGDSGTASVAVLPFDNLSDNPANGYLADGLAEELIAVLSRIPELKVPARTSSFAYRGRSIDARQIGRELAVARLVEGSVRVAGGRVRATVQLIDAATGFHLWARNFDRDLTDLLEVQDEMASAIAAALETELAGTKPPTCDLDAYHFYMQANSLVSRGSAETINEAMGLYRQAITRDPSFAQASARLAGALLSASLRGFLPLSAREEALERAEDAARIDPRLPIPSLVLGGIEAMKGRWLLAEEHFRKSQALDPRESYTPNMHAYVVLAPCGHLGRAVAATDRAFALAPAEPIHSLGKATMAGLRGDGGMVLHNLRTGMKLGLSPDEPGIRLIFAEAALLRGDWSEATEHIAATYPRELREAGAHSAALVHRARLGLIDRRAASAALKDLLADLPDDAITRFQTIIGTLALWHVRLGDLDGAFEVCARALTAWRRTGHLAAIALVQLWLPEMRPLREDPRFGEFVRQLGMLDYWRVHGPPDGHELHGDRLIVL